mmetsp:Transcript_9745/g.25565  ORF Transcript_9745/g.25565 Transcript_9745/m.25565 type:complete len:220 (+) Transcript_9745:488-1147(+)
MIGVLPSGARTRPQARASSKRATAGKLDAPQPCINAVQPWASLASTFNLASIKNASFSAEPATPEAAANMRAFRRLGSTATRSSFESETISTVSKKEPILTTWRNFSSDSCCCFFATTSGSSVLETGEKTVAGFPTPNPSLLSNLGLVGGEFSFKSCPKARGATTQSSRSRGPSQARCLFGLSAVQFSLPHSEAQLAAPMASSLGAWDTWATPEKWHAA